MGNIYRFHKEKLLIPFFVTKIELFPQLLKRLEESWGKADFIVEPSPFSFTNYYQFDMGPEIFRGFMAFESLVDPEDLAGIKILTNRIEQDFLQDGRRSVNLDPGLLTLSRLVLATTKENAHRIPLRDGIYGEITLIYRKDCFVPLEWTYPDYRSEEYNRIFCLIRTIYKAQLKQELGTDRYVR